jgi:hypothetical protein
LPQPDEHGAAVLIEIGLGERKRFLDAQPGAPQDHDEPTDYLRWVRRVAQTLVVRRTTGVEAGHRCR